MHWEFLQMNAYIWFNLCNHPVILEGVRQSVGGNLEVKPIVNCFVSLYSYFVY